MAGHLTVTFLPFDDLAIYRAKNAHDVLPNADTASTAITRRPTTKLPARNKKKARKWTLWTLWFNMYRCISLTTLLAAFLTALPVLFTRKLFTLVIALNAVGIAFAASGHFQYAEKWTTAMALGNLNCAILMRNELFGRFLYLFVNTCFAKVTIPVLYRCSGYGTYRSSVDTLMVETWLYVYPSGTLIDFQAARV